MTDSIKVFFQNTPSITIESVKSARVLESGTLMIEYIDAQERPSVRSYADGFWLSTEYKHEEDKND